MKKQIYRDWDHYWQEGNHGFSSYSRDIAEETWKDFETTITASRDDYKNAYVELMNEEVKRLCDLTDALLDYIDNYSKDGAPKFFKWWSDRMMKELKK